MKKIAVILSLALLVVLAGCAKIPQEKIDAAKAALQAAQDAQASIYAADALNAVTGKLAALDAELAVQESKFFKSYDLTAQLADEMKTLAETAKTDAIAGKEKAKNDAQAAITAAETAIVEAQEALKTAPKGKGSQADLAAMTTDVENAGKVIEEAKAAMTTEQYLDAKAKADSAKAAADKVKADVEAAKELKKGKK